MLATLSSPSRRRHSMEKAAMTTIYITHIRLSGGSGHEHITHVRWLNRATNKTDITTIGKMVEWLNSKTAKNVAKVTDGVNAVLVGVVEKPYPHLRTYADKKWTNNLLSLPRC
ncbi:DUF3892 domain-containing protein [Sorangium sp. So ce315]|uniref:DUF3892 domain-containing protein n=1 Tax=Sorangium sp. So ce315 TaxID=3133299 RepID=UPI003F62CB82